MNLFKSVVFRRCGILAVGASMLVLSSISNGADTTTDDSQDWQFGLALYLWAPSVSGELKFSPPDDASESPEVDIEQFIDALQMAFMGSFEVRKGAWSGFTDLLYMGIGGENTQTVTVPDGSSQTVAEGELDLSTWVWTLGAAYSPWQSGNSHLNLLLGARVLGLDTELKLTGLGLAQREQKLSESQQFWDGIVGVKGRIGLNQHWFIPYYLDVGTGDVDLTWQMAGGIGYGFGWGDIILDYRHLAYQSEDEFVQKLALSGGRLGFVFRF